MTGRPSLSFPCGEIKSWDKDTLRQTGEISLPLKLSGCTHIEGNRMYISSRNIMGIGVVEV